MTVAGRWSRISDRAIFGRVVRVSFTHGYKQYQSNILQICSLNGLWADLIAIRLPWPSVVLKLEVAGRIAQLLTLDQPGVTQNTFCSESKS